MKNYGIFATLAAGLMAINSLNAEALDEPIITIAAGTVERGSSVEIPVVFDNYDGFTAVQFDLTFDPSFFDEVDTSRCFNSLTGDGFLAACRRQDWPNQDVIRFLAVSLTGEPIPTGELGSLFFQASEEAVSGLSRSNCSNARAWPLALIRRRSR